MARQVKLNRAVATYPLPVVAFLLGIGRNAAYDAAADAVFPTIRVRGRIVAVAGPINRMLELSGPEDPRVQEAYRLAGFESPRQESVESTGKPSQAADGGSRPFRRTPGREAETPV
jgi:hypothetical protein